MHLSGKVVQTKKAHPESSKTQFEYNSEPRFAKLEFRKREAKLFQMQENTSISIKLVSIRVYKQDFSATRKRSLYAWYIEGW